MYTEKRKERIVFKHSKIQTNLPKITKNIIHPTKPQPKTEWVKWNSTLKTITVLCFLSHNNKWSENRDNGRMARERIRRTNQEWQEWKANQETQLILRLTSRERTRRTVKVERIWSGEGQNRRSGWEWRRNEEMHSAEIFWCSKEWKANGLRKMGWNGNEEDELRWWHLS